MRLALALMFLASCYPNNRQRARSAAAEAGLRQPWVTATAPDTEEPIPCGDAPLAYSVTGETASGEPVRVAVCCGFWLWTTCEVRP